MPENAFLTWYKLLQDKILSPIDNVIATPVNNLIFFLSMLFKDSAPGPDAKHPYPPINNSRYATEYKESVLVGAILSVIGSIIISFYKKFRDKESVSNYFFFERLFSLVGNNNENFINLRTAAYFYNPDISSILLWMRRKWASFIGNSDFKDLEKYLTETKNKTKEILLKEIYREINKQLASFITNKKKYGEWSVEEQVGEWRIKPPADYLEAWRRKKEEQEKEKSTLSIAEKIKKTFFSRILSFINSLLDGLGRASFAYWIGVFIFYFFPGMCVVSGFVWPPILIAALFLGAIWITKIYTYCQGNKQLNFDVSDIEFIAAVKHQIQLDVLLEQRKIGTLRYKKIKFKQQAKESKLCRDIRGVLGEKCTLVGVRAIFNGFVTGCFIIFFSSWLLNSAALLIVGLLVTVSSATLTLVGTVVALVTLGLGLAYGIYFAVRKYNEELEKFLDAEVKFLKLQEKCGDVEIPDISLRECDRLFRRGTTKPSAWTFIKQFFKRLWTGAIRLGTGILLLKLLPLGITTTVLYALYGVMVIPAFYPMLIVMLAGGLFFSAWHIWQYHCESKEDQAIRIMDFFLNRSYDLESSHYSLSPLLTVEEKNKVNLLEPRFNEVYFRNSLIRRISSESRLDDPDLNEVDYTGADANDVNIMLNSKASIPKRKRSNTFSGTGISKERKDSIVQINDLLNEVEEKKPELLLDPLMNENGLDKSWVRRISSESCLLDDQGLADANDVNVMLDSEEHIPQRKRSYTFPGPDIIERKRKVGIATNSIKALRLSTGSGSSGLFREQNSHSGSMSRPQADLSAGAH